MKFNVSRSMFIPVVGKPQMQVYCRIDYHLATPAIAALARSEHIYKDVKFSDHAPITVDYELSL
jgi:exonuclease III